MRIFFAALLLTTVLAGCGGTSGANLGTRNPIETRDVVVVEFSDFNCPACKSAQPIIREIKRMDGVYFEQRNFPLDIPGHETSVAAAVAFECAVQQGFGTEMNTALFENQGQFTDDLLLAIPEKYNLPLDIVAYQGCVENEETIGLVLDDVRTATRAGLSFTPSFLVNGQITRANELTEKIKAAQN